MFLNYLKPFRLLLAILIVILIDSCTLKYSRIDESLKLAGDNRKELKKVLDFYKEPRDSLKLKAAKFLIKNMMYHYCFKSENDSFYLRYFDSLKYDVPILNTGNNLFDRELRRKLLDNKILDDNIWPPKYEICWDVKNISAEFLIDNIEYAFVAWQLPWSKGYTFDQFCKYILPYRYGKEKPEMWRKVFMEEYKWIIDSLKDSADVMEVVNLLNNSIRDKFAYSSVLKKRGVKLNISNQKKALIFESCHTQAGFAVCLLRSVGVPSVILEIPRWSKGSYGHEMVAVPSINGEWHIIECFSETNLKKPNFKVPKLYFNCYELTSDSNLKDLLNAYRHDVSDELQEVLNLNIETFKVPESDIFLCVFDFSGWTPLCKGKYLNHMACFDNIGICENIYLVAEYVDGRLKPVSDVFSLLDNQQINFFRPNYEDTNVVSTIKRKYPPYSINYRVNALIGGCFQIANERDFSDAKEIFRIKEPLEYQNNIFKVDVRKAKYIRFLFPPHKIVKRDGPAEIAFYTSDGDKIKKIEGDYFASSILSEEHINILTDGNELNYLEFWDCINKPQINTDLFVPVTTNEPVWIGMEIDTFVEVEYVGICPRNDKNGIYPGMHYELLYWDKEWISHGKLIAKHDSITFSNIPDNAVLWLRNYSEGREERLFTIKNGKQIWW